MLGGSLGDENMAWLEATAKVTAQTGTRLVPLSSYQATTGDTLVATLPFVGTGASSAGADGKKGNPVDKRPVLRQHSDMLSVDLFLEEAGLYKFKLDAMTFQPSAHLGGGMSRAARRRFVIVFRVDSLDRLELLHVPVPARRGRVTMGVIPLPKGQHTLSVQVQTVSPTSHAEISQVLVYRVAHPVGATAGGGGVAGSVGAGTGSSSSNNPKAAAWGAGAPASARFELPVSEQFRIPLTALDVIPGTHLGEMGCAGDRGRPFSAIVDGTLAWKRTPPPCVSLQAWTFNRSDASKLISLGRTDGKGDGDGGTGNGHGGHAGNGGLGAKSTAAEAAAIKLASRVVPDAPHEEAVFAECLPGLSGYPDLHLRMTPKPWVLDRATAPSNARGGGDEEPRGGVEPLPQDRPETIPAPPPPPPGSPPSPPLRRGGIGSKVGDTEGNAREETEGEEEGDISVLVLWIDSLSRAMLYHKLPRTRALLSRYRMAPDAPEEEAPAARVFDFRNYNSVGGGTHSNCPPFMCGHVTDDCPVSGERWLPSIAKRLGYATMYAEADLCVDEKNSIPMILMGNPNPSSLTPTTRAKLHHLSDTFVDHSFANAACAARHFTELSSAVFTSSASGPLCFGARKLHA